MKTINGSVKAKAKKDDTKIATKKVVDVYIKGSCIVKQRRGGWSAILIYNGHEKEICGWDINTTNNRMEIVAAIMALSALKEPCEVNLYSSSTYFHDSLRYGIPNCHFDDLDRREQRLRSISAWGRRDRISSNLDLWDNLFSLCDIHKVKPIWIKSDKHNPYQNKCCKLAYEEAKGNNRLPS